MAAGHAGHPPCRAADGWQLMVAADDGRMMLRDAGENVERFLALRSSWTDHCKWENRCFRYCLGVRSSRESNRRTRTTPIEMVDVTNLHLQACIVMYSSERFCMVLQTSIFTVT